ncbi:MAG: hypothetical protein O3A00_27580, partial [Planctomycetota bacterium]|nr:hypothetical protein [Planctomycetota bacterium]
KAFQMHLVSGQTIPVTHPEFDSLPPTSERMTRTVVVWMPSGAPRVIDILRVGEIEFLEHSSADNPAG